MIAKAIEGSMTNTSLKKLRLHRGEYEYPDAGIIIRNDRPTMLYLIFKGINTATRIGVSNLEYEIDKATLAKFGNIVKEFLDGMSSNESIIIDKGERRADYVRHVFRCLLSGTKKNSII